MWWVLAVLCLAGGCDKLLGLAKVPPPVLPDAPPDALPPGNWAAVTAGFAHTCAIAASDGSLWCWGRNESGEIGIGSGRTEVDQPTRVDNAKWTAISGAANAISLCGLHDDQTLWCWGDNAWLQLGPNGPTGNAFTPVQVPGSWTQVSVGSDHVCAIATDTSLECWGQLLPAGTATPMSFGTGYKYAAAGTSASCAIKADDSLWCFGYNGSGEVGDGTTAPRNVPILIDPGTTYARVAVGLYFACGVRSDSHLRCWGTNDSGQLGDSTTSNHTLPEPVGDDDPGWQEIAVGAHTACATRTDGTLWCWGDNRHGQLASGRATALASAPRRVDVGFVDFTSVSVGALHACALSADHNLWCAGGDGYGQLGDQPSHRAPSQVAGTWHAPVAGDFDTCALDASEALWCWGANPFSQLGDGTTSPRAEPEEVSAASHASASIGNSMMCALRGDQLWCWGANVEGAFGDGTYGMSIIPEHVVSSYSWTQVRVSSGSRDYPYPAHTCGIDSTKALSCWGDNSVAQVAPGAYASYVGPWNVEPNVTAVGVGPTFTCALQANAVLCWGRNDHGELGDGTYTGRGMPMAVSLAITPVALSVGGTGACALDASGNAECWGNDMNGQLALGGGDDVKSPMGIPKTWLSLALGDLHSCGIATDHTLWCWGDDARGQLGDGRDVMTAAPQQIGGDSDWSEVTSARLHSCATKSDGRLFCWGENSDGELGDGKGWRTTLAIVPAP